MSQEIVNTDSLDRLNTMLYRMMQQAAREATARFTNSDQQLDLSKTDGIAGKLGGQRGGTGNQRGESTPIDNSVTNAKIPTAANIDPAKLDPGLLLTTIGAMIVGGGSNVTVAVVAGKITITVTGGSGVAPTLAADTDVQIVSPQDHDLLEYSAGKWRNINPVVLNNPNVLSLSGQPLSEEGTNLTLGG